MKPQKIPAQQKRSLPPRPNRFAKPPTRSFWTKQRIVYTVAAGLGLVLAGLFITLKLMTNASVTAYKQAKDTRSQAIDKAITTASSKVKARNGAESKDDIAVIESAVKDMQKALASLQQPQLSKVWLGQLLNSEYKAIEHSKQPQTAVASSTLTRVLAFSTYQKQLADIFADPVFSQTITDEMSAKTLQVAWQNATNVLQKQVAPEALKPVHEELQKAVGDATTTFTAIIELYKKYDRDALAKIQEELNAKLQAVRVISEKLEGQTVQLDTALANALKTL